MGMADAKVRGTSVVIYMYQCWTKAVPRNCLFGVFTSGACDLRWNTILFKGVVGL